MQTNQLIMLVLSSSKIVEISLLKPNKKLQFKKRIVLKV